MVCLLCCASRSRAMTSEFPPPPASAANAVSGSLWVSSAATRFIGFLDPRVKRAKRDAVLSEPFPVKGNGVRERGGPKLRQLVQRDVLQIWEYCLYVLLWCSHANLRVWI